MALVDIGDHRSPTKIPDITAPAVKSGETPSDAPIVIEITPMVATVPKDVPVRTESSVFAKKMRTRKNSGRMRSDTKITISGIVPAARQLAVSIPIKRNVMRMPLTVRTPSSDISQTSLRPYPRKTAKPAKRRYPPASAYRMESPDATQKTRSAPNNRSTTA